MVKPWQNDCLLSKGSTLLAMRDPTCFQLLYQIQNRTCYTHIGICDYGENKMPYMKAGLSLPAFTRGLERGN